MESEPTLKVNHLLEVFIYLPWQILFYGLAASFAGIVVSLLTAPVSPSQLNRFYDLSRTPVQPGEEVTLPCTVPAGTAIGVRRMLITAGGLEIPMPSKTSVVGFIAVWVVVGAIIGAFVWVVS